MYASDVCRSKIYVWLGVCCIQNIIQYTDRVPLWVGDLLCSVEHRNCELVMHILLKVRHVKSHQVQTAAPVKVHSHRLYVAKDDLSHGLNNRVELISILIFNGNKYDYLSTGIKNKFIKHARFVSKILRNRYVHTPFYLFEWFAFSFCFAFSLTKLLSSCFAFVYFFPPDQWVFVYFLFSMLRSFVCLLLVLFLDLFFFFEFFYYILTRQNRS